ncbi:glycosyltransferase family A protein [Nitratidesulfovibrio sp. D1]|uniref:glycosyltransferase family A protein n=1 Tax=Nitratidesulfovibrio sp. D1 TaxID=3440151 RepID=UPI003EBE57C7
MTKVSIIIPCRDDGQYLEEAFSSALAQTHPEVEIIIVDDGSESPATLSVFEKLRARGVRILPSLGSGPAAARNTGIAAASGNYILPLDADDVIHPNYVAKASAVLDANPRIGICYCRAELFGLKCGVWQRPVFSLEEMLVENMIFATALFRWSDWQSVGGYDESLVTGLEDHAFWISLLERGAKVHCLDETLFRYRVRPRSRTASLHISQRDEQAALAVFSAHRLFYERHCETLFLECRALRKERAQRECLVSWKFAAPLLRLEWRLRELLKRVLGRA